VSFDMTKRTTTNGMVTRVDARVYYQSTGEMVTNFIAPIKLTILNNSLGEVRIYNSAENSVIKSLDNRMSSQNTTFFYFLVGNSGDMGLESAGFRLRDSRVEDMLLVSEWTPPIDAAREIDYVELVDNGDHPVFMAYLDKNGTYIKKIFYYDFDMVGDVDFPKSITEIDFINMDSVITKTSFSEFKFDDERDVKMINFSVPDNATLISK
jgi:hypothetical protein